LQVVVMFHPKLIVEKLDPKYCYCKKGERQKSKKSKKMVQCVDCWEWFHFDCVELAEDADVQDVEWKCGWCVQAPDKEGKHRGLFLGRKRANCVTIRTCRGAAEVCWVETLLSGTVRRSLGKEKWRKYRNWRDERQSKKKS
jgi:hypothetical protein